MCGLILLAIGFIFSFSPKELNFRPFYIGIPLITGFLILTFINVFKPLKETGRLIVTKTGIEINDITMKTMLSVHFSDVNTIELLIKGFEMELNKDWRIFSTRDFFPHQHGDDNVMKIKKNNNIEHKTSFFLQNKTSEKILIQHLKTLSEQFNFKLIIKN